MQGLMDQELALQATPIVKKVILNPKTYLFYDYACSTLNFKGDIGDFIQDAIARATRRERPARQHRQSCPRYHRNGSSSAASTPPLTVAQRILLT
jgi:hypothetical protein